jgi:hypothetical protein
VEDCLPTTRNRALVVLAVNLSFDAEAPVIEGPAVDYTTSVLAGPSPRALRHTRVRRRARRNGRPVCSSAPRRYPRQRWQVRRS